MCCVCSAVKDVSEAHLELGDKYRFVIYDIMKVVFGIARYCPIL
ncbi:hypothetical protein SAMN04489864_109102 [Pedobacter insulae]|uniref:Uncharacterized protein n=1 Tax=Pedobacter insulae TaxID=414048 RepID=A0A1I2ZAU3_9SPHI|nr:hypothetical protein SAMN04489864_109102 [Pedobacter insulae]